MTNKEIVNKKVELTELMDDMVSIDFSGFDDDTQIILRHITHDGQVSAYQVSYGDMRASVKRLFPPSMY